MKADAAATRAQGRVVEGLRSRTFRVYAGAGTASGAAGVLAAWHAGWPGPIGLLPGLTGMQPVTAFTLAAAGLALTLHERFGARGRMAVRRALAVLGLLLAFELAAYLAGAGPTLEHALLPPGFVHERLALGSIGPYTAATLAMLVVAVLLATADSPRAFRRAPVVALAALGLAAIAAIGYALSAAADAPFLSYTRMALHTSFAVSLLAVAVLALRPDTGVARSFLGRDLAAHLNRRWTAIVLGGVPGLALLLNGALEANAIRQGLAMALLSTGTIALAVGNGIVQTRLLRRADLLRRRAAAARERLVARLARQADHLEREVESRTRDLDRLALVARLTTNAVVITDAAGRIEWVNEGFVRLTGFGLKEVSGRTPGAMLQGEATDAGTREYLRARVQAGREAHAEVLNYRRDGTPYWQSLDIVPIRAADGALQGFVGVQTDLTERRQLEAALATATAAEQKRLAAELHDSLGQQLAGARLLASSCATRIRRHGAVPAEELERLSEVIGDALHECRQIARSTSGFVRESGGFEQSLTELAARVCRTAPLEIEVDWDPAIDSGLDGPHSHELFRIVQESLNNVVRHARATRVTIVGRADQAVCEVRVEDDGVGLEDAPRGAGVGLRIMEYRAGLFGARVAVRARRPRGTCVTVTWPRRSAAAGGLVFGQPGREQHRETT